MIAIRNSLKYSVFLSCNLRLILEILAVPTTSLINKPGHLRTGESVFVAKKRLIRCVALEKNSKVKPAEEFIDASLYLFGEDSAL